MRSNRTCACKQRAGWGRADWPRLKSRLERRIDGVRPSDRAGVRKSDHEPGVCVQVDDTGRLDKHHPPHIMRVLLVQGESLMCALSSLPSPPTWVEGTPENVLGYTSRLGGALQQYYRVPNRTHLVFFWLCQMATTAIAVTRGVACSEEKSSAKIPHLQFIYRNTDDDIGRGYHGDVVCVLAGSGLLAGWSSRARQLWAKAPQTLTDRKHTFWTRTIKMWLGVFG